MWEKQEIKDIKIEDLKLWTENPRDPIIDLEDLATSDESIVYRALNNNLKWGLKKLAEKMGSTYDLSELPTVVYKDGIPVVYDGNRRVALAKLKLGIVDWGDNKPFDLPSFPEIMPCNVCAEKVAIESIKRKHYDTGSWKELDREYFKVKFEGKRKSNFLKFEENTGLISRHPKLNQRFVREETLSDKNLKKIGLELNDGSISSPYSKSQLKEILYDLTERIVKKEITTRKNRGKLYEALSPQVKNMIDENREKEKSVIRLEPDNIQEGNEDTEEANIRKSKRTKKKAKPIFGKKLKLKAGDINNLYRDIDDLHGFYLRKRNKLSDSFPGLLRMALRLITEASKTEVNDRSGNIYKDIGDYARKMFDKAKKELGKDDKTTLSSQNVRKDTITQLLHTGAHNYSAAKNYEQMMAMSIIIGRILELNHSK